MRGGAHAKACVGYQEGTAAPSFANLDTAALTARSAYHTGVVLRIKLCVVVNAAAREIDAAATHAVRRIRTVALVNVVCRVNTVVVVPAVQHTLPVAVTHAVLFFRRKGVHHQNRRHSSALPELHPVVSRTILAWYEPAVHLVCSAVAFSIDSQIVRRRVFVSVRVYLCSSKATILFTPICHLLYR